MTGTVDIQELKNLAEAALRRPLNAYHEASIEAVNFYRAASPSTLLALIEVAEAAMPLVDRDIDYIGPQVRMKFETHSEAFSAVLRLRTALEGVKK